jgi:flagellar L-ring protein precursor FlgH
MKKAFLAITCLAMMLSGIFGCSNSLREAKEIREAPMPPKYFETKDREVKPSEGSLWRDSASLFEDRKARRVNDLVTILITETTTATKQATTNTSNDSSANFSRPNVFNIDKMDFGIQKLPLLGGALYQNNKFSPEASGNRTGSFVGSGDTARSGTLRATITAKVIEVLPNNNMILESRKEVLVNNEKEIIVLRGIVRPDDITTNNTVLSQNVGDAQIYMVGEGAVADKQSQGWLVRFLDGIWPF